MESGRGRSGGYPMAIHSHLGTGFEVWNGQRTWFWIVIDPNPNRNGGEIGAAVSEADAVRDARASIEEIVAQRGATPPALAADTDVPVCLRRSSWSARAVVRWEISLSNLERYLASLHRTAT